jgi:mono/diheme cytochrome c family protein
MCSLLTSSGFPEAGSHPILTPLIKDIRTKNQLWLGAGRGFLVALIFLLPTTLMAQDAQPWVVPADATKARNPVPMTGEGLTATAPVYEQNCARCHGVTGAGTGPAASSLPKEPAKFTDAKMLKSTTDGELFWMITTGRGTMPSYAQLSDLQRWQLVNYVRDLARRSQYRWLGVKHAR